MTNPADNNKSPAELLREVNDLNASIASRIQSIRFNIACLQSAADISIANIDAALRKDSNKSA